MAESKTGPGSQSGSQPGPARRARPVYQRLLIGLACFLLLSGLLTLLGLRLSIAPRLGSDQLTNALINFAWQRIGDKTSGRRFGNFDDFSPFYRRYEKRFGKDPRYWQLKLQRERWRVYAEELESKQGSPAPDEDEREKKQNAAQLAVCEAAKTVGASDGGLDLMYCILREGQLSDEEQRSELDAVLKSDPEGIGGYALLCLALLSIESGGFDEAKELLKRSQMTRLSYPQLYPEKELRDCIDWPKRRPLGNKAVCGRIADQFMLPSVELVEYINLRLKEALQQAPVTVPPKLLWGLADTLAELNSYSPRNEICSVLAAQQFEVLGAYIALHKEEYGQQSAQLAASLIESTATAKLLSEANLELAYGSTSFETPPKYLNLVYGRDIYAVRLTEASFLGAQLNVAQAAGGYREPWIALETSPLFSTELTAALQQHNQVVGGAARNVLSLRRKKKNK